MTHIEPQLFRIFDRYARANHGCFVSERFWRPEAENYVLCFRPLAPTRNINDSRYFQIDPTVAEMIVSCDSIPADISESLKADLESLAEDTSQDSSQSGASDNFT